MSFCNYSTELIVNNKTSIDNVFVTDYLCDAPDYCLKTYIYGLYLCNNPSEDVYNTLSSFSSKLNMSEQDIESAFLYWQERGLVQVINTTPIEIKYLPISYGTRANVKLDENKFGNFIAAVTELIKGREISKTELFEYCDTIERYHIEIDAMIQIIQYCVNLKRSNVGYRYIISVARNWANEGINTSEKVSEKLQDYVKTNEAFDDMKKAAGIKTATTIENRDTFNKWQAIGFTNDTLFHIAIYLKKSKQKTTFDKIDNFIMKCYEMHLMSINEIDDYLKQKDLMINLASTVCKNLGVYYENLDPVVENYISKWINLGYESDLIETLSTYCFKNAIRTLPLMDNLLLKFFKLGITTKEGLNEYLDQTIAQDEQIKNLILELGLVRNVNNYDRSCFKTWTEEWKTPAELITYACDISKNKANPMQYMNKVLSLYKTQNIITLDQAKAFDLPKLLYAQNNKKNSENREYSTEQLSAMFTNLEEIEI